MTEATGSISAAAPKTQAASANPIQAGRRSRWLVMLVGAVVLAIGGSAALVWERFHAGASVRYVTSAASVGPITRAVART
jgi:hypothetical protein